MNRIRQCRLAKGFTMAELGKRVDCSEASISYYELGKREAKYETLLRIAEVLEVTVDYLLGNSPSYDSPAYNSFYSKVDQMSAELWASKHAAAAEEFRSRVTPDMTEEQMQALAESIRSRYEGYQITKSTDLLSALSELSDAQLDEMFMQLISGKDKDYLYDVPVSVWQLVSASNDLIDIVYREAF